jgi:hypothetical protein
VESEEPLFASSLAVEGASLDHWLPARDRWSLAAFRIYCSVGESFAVDLTDARVGDSYSAPLVLAATRAPIDLLFAMRLRADDRTSAHRGDLILFLLDDDGLTKVGSTSLLAGTARPEQLQFPPYWTTKEVRLYRTDDEVPRILHEWSWNGAITGGLASHLRQGFRIRAFNVSTTDVDRLKDTPLNDWPAPVLFLRIQPLGRVSG